MILSDIEKFFKNHNIDYQIVTPFNQKDESIRLIELYGLKIPKKVSSSSKYFKKLQNGNDGSKIVVFKHKKVVFEQQIIALDTSDIPIIPKTIKPHYSEKIPKGIPYFLNDIVNVNNSTIVHNIIYDRTYIIQNPKKKAVELKIDEVYFDCILKEDLKFNPDSIVSIKNLMKENNISLFKNNDIYSCGKHLYMLVSLHLPIKEHRTFESKLYFLKLNSDFSVDYFKSIPDAILRGKDTFYTQNMFGFAYNPKEKELYISISRGYNNSKYTDPNDTSFYHVGKFVELEKGFEYEKVLSIKLPPFYIDNNHFYRNLWANYFFTIDNQFAVYYKHLNLIQMDNKVITLQGLDVSQLKLSDYPGGESTKPFSILNVAQIDTRTFVVVYWNNKETLCSFYNNEGVLISSTIIQKNAVLMPGAETKDNILTLIQGRIAGKNKLIKYRFN